MFSSKLFTVTALLSMIMLLATLVIQVIEMNDYELFKTLF